MHKERPLAQGFTVSAGSLTQGSQDIASLLSTCEKISSEAVAALSGMAGAVGQLGLAGALAAACDQGTKAFLDVGAAYAYTGESLKASAAAYGGAERDTARRISGIRNGVG
jgi:hypothetical protein